MRARSLKPGYFKNEQLAALPPFARILFAGLWGLADREGRLRDNSRLISAEIFPYEQHNVEKLLAVLAAVREPNGEGPAFILRYESNSARYIQIVNFTCHQNPHVKEPPSTIPAPGESGAKPGARPGAQHQKKPVLSRADSGLRTPDSGLRTPAAPVPSPVLARAADRGGGVVRKSPGTGNGTDPSPEPDPLSLGPPRRKNPTRWPAVLAQLRTRIDEREFDSWLRDSYELEDEALTVHLRAPLFVDYVAETWGFDIFTTAKEPVVLVSGSARIRLVFASEPASAEPDATSEPARSGP